MVFTKLLDFLLCKIIQWDLLIVVVKWLVNGVHFQKVTKLAQLYCLATYAQGVHGMGCWLTSFLDVSCTCLFNNI